MLSHALRIHTRGCHAAIDASKSCIPLLSQLRPELPPDRILSERGHTCLESGKKNAPFAWSEPVDIQAFDSQVQAHARIRCASFHSLRSGGWYRGHCAGKPGDERSHDHSQPRISAGVRERSSFPYSLRAPSRMCFMPIGCPSSAAKKAACSAIFRITPPGTLSCASRS